MQLFIAFSWGVDIALLENSIPVPAVRDNLRQLAACAQGAAGAAPKGTFLKAHQPLLRVRALALPAGTARAGFGCRFHKMLA